MQTSFELTILPYRVKSEIASPLPALCSFPMLMFTEKIKFYSHDSNDSVQKKNQLNVLIIYNFTWG